MTLRSTEFNEGGEISSTLKLTAEKRFGRQRRGHSRHLVYCGSSLRKGSCKKVSQNMFLKKKTNKKSKVIEWPKEREDRDLEIAVGQESLEKGQLQIRPEDSVTLLSSIFLLARVQFYSGT